MPSPVGHSIIAGAFWLAVALPYRWQWAQLPSVLKENALLLILFVFACNAPDLDYLVGIGGNMNHTHHWYTHTLGWVALLAVALAMIWRMRDRSRGIRFAFLLFLMGVTHLITDLLGKDYSAPHGIMALWPFTDAFLYDHSLTVFLNLEKNTASELVSLHNLMAIGLEMLILLPFPLAVMWWKKRSGKMPPQSD